MMSFRISPMGAAVALSVIAHSITLTGTWMQLPQDKADPAPLTAQLKPMAPAPAVQPTAAPQQVAAKPRATTVAAAPAIIRTDAPAAVLPAEPLAEASTEALEPMPIATQPEAPAPAPEAVAAAGPSTLATDPATIKSLPRKGRIDYNFLIHYKGTMADVARTAQTWEAVGNTYRIESKSVPLPITRMLSSYGAHDYQSSGQVTEAGLVPLKFASKEVRPRNTLESGAQFDWDKQTLQFGRNDEPKSAALPAGSQDVVSFMFQLSLAPPPRGRVQMPITTGRVFETYELEVLDEEILETPMGPLRVLPVKRVPRPGLEGITVYLATEYRHLPVRVLHFKRDGTPGGEIIATAIRVE
jgi:Protein of unknown function (DUF3108)